ncbi:MAG TPA: hypothetical protein VJA23_03840 [Candidatus Nanoarchaeia archaeon]|nr:hypothetical protein [Candidatus Nanoarchaeia archaeon]
MGTTTFYLKHNDLGLPLDQMSKEALETLSKLHPSGENNRYGGWTTPMEFHNGNIYLLVFWKGRLMRIDDAPKILNKKYYNKYSGKMLREYEWTWLRRIILNEVADLDKEFKKSLRRKKNGPR